MRVIVCSPIPGIAIEISVALGLVDIDCEVEPSPQQFGSLLYREPDAIGLFWSMGPVSAAETCRRLRMGDIRNALFAIIEEANADFTGGAGRALALAAGADDIQQWPLDPSELVARLFALHRRRRSADDDTYMLPGCTFHPARGQLIGASSTVHLTKQESVLLATLAERPGMLITKAMCMLALYQGHDEAKIKIIDVYACKLRKKILAATGGLDVIETVWGQGYRFVPEGYRPEVSSQGKRTIG